MQENPSSPVSPTQGPSNHSPQTRRSQLPRRRGLAFSVCLGLLVTTGCLTKFVLHSGFQPHAAPESVLASVAPLRVAMLDPIDARPASKQIGHFDPNNLDLMTAFTTEDAEEDELARDLAKLLASVGIAIDPSAPIALRLGLRQYIMSGRRRFDDTTFSAGLAFDIQVFGKNRDQPEYTGGYAGRADTRGTSSGAQDRYFNEALTNAVAKAMRDVSNDKELAEALLSVASRAPLPLEGR